MKVVNCNQNDNWCPMQQVEKCLLCPSGNTYALSLRRYINASEKGLVAFSFQSLEFSVESALPLLLQFCQPVIKPKTVLTQLF